MICQIDGCGNVAEAGRDICFRHRVASVGFAMKGPAQEHNFHQTTRDWKEEHLGTSDDRELAKRGIERSA